MAGNRELYDQALTLGAQRAWDHDWRRAIEHFEVARSEFPEDPIPHSRLGQAYYELTEYEEAFHCYQQAVRLDPNDVVALARTADILERLGRISEAARIYMAVAEAGLKGHDLESAVSNWERATRLDADLLGARQRLALAYHKMGRRRDAVREHLALARIYQARGNLQQAAAVCQAALEFDPGNQDVLAAVRLLQQGLEVQEPSPPQREAPPADPSAEAPQVADPEVGDEMALGAEAAVAEEGGGGPVEDARRAALADLAEMIFEEEPSATDALSEREDWDALISQAIDSQTRGAVDEAIDTYESAIAAGFSEPAAHFNLGLLYQERLRLDGAIEQLCRSVEDPEFRLASHLALGECYRARGRFEEAIAHFLEVAKIVDMPTVRQEQTDDLVRLYESLADTYAMKGEQERAVVFANALVEFLNTRGWQEKAKEARERLDVLAEGDQTVSLAEILAIPGSEQLLQSISLTNEYARQGWLDTALEECHRAIQLAPYYLPSHLRLARLLEQRGNIEAAGGKYVSVAAAYQTRGDPRRAMDNLERAVALSPLDMVQRSRLINMLKGHGETDRALDHTVAMAEAYYQLAQVDKARDTYETALQLAPRGSPERQWTVSLLHRIADIDMQRLAWRDAVSVCLQIVREAPLDERANITLVELMFKMGQSFEALAELDRFLASLAALGRSKKILAVLNDLLAQHPDDTGLLNRLAAAYAQAGEREKAIGHLDRLGELQLDAGLREEAARTIRAILALEPAEAEGYQHLLAQITELS